MIIDDHQCLFCDELALPYDNDASCALCVRHTMGALSSDEDDYVICAEADQREEHQQATAAMVPQTGECNRMFCYEDAHAIISVDATGTFVPAWEYCNGHAVDNYLGRLPEIDIINGIMYEMDLYEEGF